MKHCIRLPLKHTVNTRDLGGYVTQDGRITKWNVFVRSDDPRRLDKDECTFLKEYGVSTIIDLRSPNEVMEMPHPKFDGMEDVNIPLVCDLTVGDVTQIEIDTGSVSMEMLYIYILENSAQQIKKVFETIHRSSGAVLFHCAVGKDRTGIIAALLLGLVNARENDIVANYEVSYSYLSSDTVFINRLNSLLQNNLSVDNFYSKTEYIKGMLTHMKKHYGSARAYLLAIGVQGTMLNDIAARFTETL